MDLRTDHSSTSCVMYYTEYVCVRCAFHYERSIYYATKRRSLRSTSHHQRLECGYSCRTAMCVDDSTMPPVCTLQQIEESCGKAKPYEAIQLNSPSRVRPLWCCNLFAMPPQTIYPRSVCCEPSVPQQARSVSSAAPTTGGASVTATPTSSGSVVEMPSNMDLI